MLRRAPTLALLLLTTCGTIPSVADRPPIDRAALDEKIEFAERVIGERFLSPEGLLLYRRAADQPPGPPAPPYGNLADSACWGGYYLGAEALRFAATGGDEASRRTDRALAGIELLEAVTGHPGLFARSAEPNDGPEILSRSGDPWRRGAIPGWAWRGGVSRDQYAGVLFGLGCVLRHGPEHLRGRAGKLLTAIATRLDAHDLEIRDTDGGVTTHGNLADRFLGFPIAPNASIVLAAFRLSAAAGSAEHARRYADLVEDGYARSASFAKISVLGKAKRSNDHMTTAGLYHLHALETNAEVRELYRRGLARVGLGVRGEENAYMLGLHMAASGTDAELLAEAWSALARLPADQRSGPVDLRGKVSGVVPIELRPATAFTWRSNPYNLVKDPEGTRAPVQYAPVDLVLAYWLLRAHGLDG